MGVSPCPAPSAPVRGIVTFDPAAFIVAFPEFATVPAAALTANFGLAQLQLANTCGSRVCDANQRDTLLQLLVCHITQLRNGINGNPPQGIVGRVSDATEGSVSVSADMGEVVYGQAYYVQTQFGAMYWEATSRYRRMVYIVAPPTCADFAGAGPQPFGPLTVPQIGPGGGGCGC